MCDPRLAVGQQGPAGHHDGTAVWCGFRSESCEQVSTQGGKLMSWKKVVFAECENRSPEVVEVGPDLNVWAWPVQGRGRTRRKGACESPEVRRGGRRRGPPSASRQVQRVHAARSGHGWSESSGIT